MQFGAVADARVLSTQEFLLYWSDCASLNGMEASTREVRPRAPAVGDEEIEASGESSPEVSISQAFGLGWNICCLFLPGDGMARSGNGRPDRLPSPRLFSDDQRLEIRLGQVRMALSHLESGVPVPGGKDAVELEAAEHLAVLESNGGPPPSPTDAERTQALRDAHVALARDLSCRDPRLAKAYHLGVALADTCHPPADRESLEEAFDPARTAQIGEWLADLTAALPHHAGRAVRLSCATWRQWVDDPQFEPTVTSQREGDEAGRMRRAKALATRDTDELEWSRDGRQVRRALVRQGEVWRALLTGEKPGNAMLELQDYVSAAGRSLRHGLRLIKGLWPAFLVALILLVAATWILVANDSAAAKVIGIVTLAGSVGVTWKGIFGGVGSVVAKLQRPVWGAALDEEVAAAITELPNGARLSGEKASAAAPAAGPEGGDVPLREEVLDSPELAA